MKPFTVAEKELAALMQEARAGSAAASKPRLSCTERVDSAARHLEALGDLWAAGASNKRIDPVPDSLAIQAVKSLAPAALEKAADELHDLLKNVIADPDDEAIPRHVSRVHHLLTIRHRCGRRVEGAGILGIGDVTPGELQKAMAYFDEQVRPLAWAMAFAHEARELHLSSIARENRSASWWWSEGIDVDRRAVELVTETAEFVARYPSFERYLARGVEAARARQSTMPGEDTLEPLARS